MAKKSKKRKKNVAKAFKNKAEKIVHGNKRPLPFLKKMAAKMEKNLPKLQAIIKARGG
jgi:hypothetical protein